MKTTGEDPDLMTNVMEMNIRKDKREWQKGRVMKYKKMTQVCVLVRLCASLHMKDFF